MNRAFRVAVGVCVSMVGLGIVARGEMTPSVRAIVEAEKAFAQASVAKGTREAFLEYLADDSLLFRPGPVPGKMFHRNRPSPPGKLFWAPSFADAASSDDLGYTTGPYEFRKGEMTETPASWGHYLSIWRKQRDGQWKVEVELGISHEKNSVAVADVKNVETPSDATGGAKPPAAASGADAKPAAAAPASAAKPEATATAKPSTAKPADAKAADAKPADAKPAAGTTGAAPAAQAQGGTAAPAPGKPATPAPLSPTKQAEEAMKEVDRTFSKLVAEQGAVKAFLASSSDGVRVYRNGSLPLVGKAAIEKLQPNALGNTWQPAHARVSASGDFAYTTGMISMDAAPTPGAQSQPHYYVRIWRKDKAGAWKLALDIVN